MKLVLAAKLTVEDREGTIHIGVAGSDKKSRKPPAHGLGTTDADFCLKMQSQAIDLGITGKAIEASGPNFVPAVIAGIEPRDQLEAMLAVQMAAVHDAATTFARRLAHIENVPQQDSASNALNKLMRTFTMQLDALRTTPRRAKG